MTLLQKIHRRRADEREHNRQKTVQNLKRAVRELLPETAVVVFGSILKRGAFGDSSDVDLALFSEPPQGTIFGLIAELEERLHRPVDVILLNQCRFKEKIIEQGELWTN